MNPPSDSRTPPAGEPDTIASAAADWLTRQEEGLTPAEARAFAQWRRADPRHAAAFDRLEETHALLERLPFAVEHLGDVRDSGSSFAPAPPPRPARALRPRRAWYAAAAAAAVLASLAWWPWSASPRFDPERYATVAGGYERVILADGSALELNSDSEAIVRYSPRERQVTLTAGEAHFSVVRDAHRPFVVTAGTLAVRAVGTAFNVRYAAQSVEVIVTAGRVRIAPGKTPPPAAAAARESQPLLEVGQRVLIPAEGSPGAARIEQLDPTALRQALAWQERRLNFVDTPLREVVAHFNQRNQTQLVLVDPELGGRPVGGTFAIGNVEAFVRLMQSSGDIAAERRGEHEILLRRTR